MTTLPALSGLTALGASDMPAMPTGAAMQIPAANSAITQMTALNNQRQTRLVEARGTGEA